MRTLLKIVGWGVAGLAAVAGLLVGASFLFPRLFAPKIKTTELRAPSGAVFQIMQRGPITGVKGSARTLGVQYLAETLGDAARLSREADELEALLRPESETGGFDTVIVMAYRIVGQKGLVSYGRSVNTVFQRALTEPWDIFNPKPASGLGPKEQAVRGELLEAYARLDKAVKEKDPRAIFEMETPDYVDKLLTGESLDKAADMAYMQKQFAGLTSVSDFSVDIQELSLEGDKARVLVRSSFSGVVNDARRKDETYFSSGYSRDVWKRTPAGWRISSSEDLGSKSFFFKP